MLAGRPGRRVHQPRVPLRDGRARRALLARAEQAAPDGDRRLARRWSSTTTRANEPVRIFDSGATIPDPETFGEYQLSYRTGDIVSPRIEATEPLSLELADFCESILEGTPLVSSAAVGLDVVRTIEAVDRSLAEGGIPVRVDGAELDASCRDLQARIERFGPTE